MAAPSRGFASRRIIVDVALLALLAGGAYLFWVAPRRGEAKPIRVVFEQPGSRS